MASLYDVLPDSLKQQYRALDPVKLKALQSADASQFTPAQVQKFLSAAPALMPHLTVQSRIAKINAAHPDPDPAAVAAQSRDNMPRRGARLAVEGALAPFSGLPGLPKLERTTQPRNWQEGLAQGAAGIPATMAMALPVTVGAAELGVPALVARAAVGRGVPLAVARALGSAAPNAVTNVALGAAHGDTWGQRAAGAAAGLVGSAGEVAGPIMGGAARWVAPLASYGVAQPEAAALLGPEHRLATGQEIGENASIAGLMSMHALAPHVAKAMGRKVFEQGGQPSPMSTVDGSSQPNGGVADVVQPLPSREAAQGPKVVQRLPRSVSARGAPEAPGSAGGAAPEGGGAQHRKGLRKPRQVAEAAVPGVRVDGEGGASPPELQQAAQGRPPVPETPLGTARGEGVVGRRFGKKVGGREPRSSGAEAQGTAAALKTPSQNGSASVEPANAQPALELQGKAGEPVPLTRAEVPPPAQTELSANGAEDPAPVTNLRAAPEGAPATRSPADPEGAAPASPPKADNEPGKFAKGDGVTVPNLGRGGKDRMQGKVVGYNADGTVIVQVRRGMGKAHFENHPEEHLLRQQRQRGMARRERVEKAAGKVADATPEDLIAEHGQLASDLPKLEQAAKDLYPQRGEKPSPEYRRARAAWTKAQERGEAIHGILIDKGYKNERHYDPEAPDAWVPDVDHPVNGGRGGFWINESGSVPVGKIAEDIRKASKAVSDYRAEGEAIMRGEGQPASGRETPPPAPKPASTKPAHHENLIQALSDAKPVVGEQKKVFSTQRTARVAKAQARGKGLEGDAWLKATSPPLRGKLRRLAFEPLSEKISAPDAMALKADVTNSKKLRFFEKRRASNGLKLLLDGELPRKHEIKLLQRVFGPDLVRALAKHSPMGDKILAAMENTAGLVKSLQSTADFSASLRQGLVLGAGNPRRFAQAFRKQFEFFAHPEAYDALHEHIVASKHYELMVDSGLNLSEHGALMGENEEQFRSAIAENLPGIGHVVKASERAYTGFLNKLRSDVFGDMVERYKDLGLDPHKDINVAKEISDYINDATGRGKLPKFAARSSRLLNTVMYSPRLQASRIRLMNPLRYMNSSPALRKEAARAAVNMAAIGGTMLGLAALGGAKVEMDPRSSDFLKARTGNTRVDLFGGFLPYVRLATVLASYPTSAITGHGWHGTVKQNGVVKRVGQGQTAGIGAILQRFLRSKASPALNMAIDETWGKDMVGHKINRATYLAQQVLPLVSKDMWDAMKEWGPAGAVIASPAIFGVGVQTYGGHTNKMKKYMTRQTSTTPTESREAP